MATKMRLKGIIREDTNFSTIDNSLKAVAVVIDSKTGQPARKVNTVIIDKGEKAIEIDMVLDDSQDPQQLINSIKSMIGSRDCRLKVHRCNHIAFGGLGGACDEPHLTLIQGM